MAPNDSNARKVFLVDKTARRSTHPGASGNGMLKLAGSKFDTLIKGCAHSGDIDRAECLFRMMHECSESPNLDNYNAIVHACTQAGDIARAKEYLLRMEEIGLNPNTVTYNLVINACAAQGDAAQAEKWLLHMYSRGLKPNEVTYGTICKVLARGGNVMRIEEIMIQLEQNGLSLNEYFYASLISACGAATPPNLPRAEQALFEMVSRGLRPKSVKRALARVVGERRTQQLFAALELRSTERKAEAAAKGRSPTAACASSGLLVPPPGLFPKEHPVSMPSYAPQSGMYAPHGGVRLPPGLEYNAPSPPSPAFRADEPKKVYSHAGPFGHGEGANVDHQAIAGMGAYKHGMSLREAAKLQMPPGHNQYEMSEVPRAVVLSF